MRPAARSLNGFSQPVRSFIPTDGDRYLVRPQLPFAHLRRRLHAGAFAAALVVAHLAAQTSGTWTNTTDATAGWSNSANWSGGAIPDGASDQANFTATLATDQTISLDADRALQTLNIGSQNSFSYTLAAGNTVNFIGYAPSLTVASGSGDVTINSALNISGSSSFGFIVYQNSTHLLTLSGAISGSSSLVLHNSSTGTVLLGTTPTYTGATDVEGGVLRLGAGVSLPNTPTYLQISGVLEFAGGGLKNLTLGQGNGQIYLGTGSVGFSTIGGDLELKFNGGAEIVWLGNSNFTASSLKLGSAGSDSTITVDNAINLSIAATNLSKSINVSDGSATIDAILAGNIRSTGTGTSIFGKSGAGTLKLLGTNSYTGNTLITGGVLQFAKEVSLYNNTTASWTATKLVVSSGATAAFNVGDTGEFTSSDLDTLLALGTSTGGFKTGARIGLDTTNAAGGNFTYGSVIANPNSGANVLGLTKLGTGTLTLTAANTYTGTTIVSAGTLALSGSGTIGAGTNALTVSGGTLDVGSTNQTVGAVTLSSGTITGSTGTLNGSTYTASGGTLAATLTGSGALGVTGAVAVSGNNSGWSGTTHIQSGGNLSAGHDSALGSGTATIDSGGTLTIDAHAIANTIVFNSTSGTAPTISSNGGSLSGTFSGSGTLTGPLTLTASAVYLWNLAALSTSTGFSQLTLASGNLSIAAGASLGVTGSTPSSDPFWQSSRSWTLLTNTGSGTVIGVSLAVDNSTWSELGTFNTQLTDTDVTLTWTPESMSIPEPSTYAVCAGVAALGFVWWRRRRGLNTAPAVAR